MIGLISTSAKHGGRGDPNSAVEELIYALNRDLAEKRLVTDVFSFRADRMPLPNGMPLDQQNESECERLCNLLDANRFLILGLTAYLGHISAASKAFFEHVSGANYDVTYPDEIPISDFTAAIVVVGTDPLTTANGAIEAADLRNRLGWAGGEVFALNNPRQNPIDYSAVSFAVFSQLSDWLSKQGNDK